MRSVAVVVLLILLAGCSSPAADEASPTTQAPIGPGRQARPGAGSGAGGPEHKDVTLVDGPITLIGPGPITFDAEVPANTTHVTYILTSANDLSAAMLRIELEGCGVYEEQGFRGSSSVGGTITDSGFVCETATEGRHTATVSATFAHVEGTFTLMGWIVASGNSTAVA